METAEREKIKKIQETFDINAIYAWHVFDCADKNNLMESSLK